MAGLDVEHAADRPQAALERDVQVNRFQYSRLVNLDVSRQIHGVRSSRADGHAAVPRKSFEPVATLGVSDRRQISARRHAHSIQRFAGNNRARNRVLGFVVPHDSRDHGSRRRNVVELGPMDRKNLADCLGAAIHFDGFHRAHERVNLGGSDSRSDNFQQNQPVAAEAPEFDFPRGVRNGGGEPGQGSMPIDSAGKCSTVLEAPFIWPIF